MGDWQDIPLAITEGRSISPFESSQRVDNLMLVPNPPGSARKYAVLGTPAITAGLGFGAGVMRAVAVVPTALTLEGSVWYVRGSHLWMWSPDTSISVDFGALTGAVSTTAACRIVPTGPNAAVVVCPEDGKAWYCTTNFSTGTVTAVSLPAGSIQDVAWQDGYTIYLRKATDEWYISALDDPTTINALDFTTIDALPDKCVSVCSVNRELIVFGSSHAEIYYNSGDNLFPFTRQQPGLMQPGATLEAPASLAVFGDTAFYLGKNYRVYAVRGYSADAISDPWVEALIAGGTIYVGSAYVEKGRRLYSLSTDLPGLGSIVYDIDAGVWHTRSHIQGGATTATTHAGIVNYSNLIYIAANRPSSASDLSQYSFTAYRDAANSTDTLRTLVLPAVEAAGRPVFESDVRVDMERTTGVAGTIQFDYFDESATAGITHGAASSQADGGTGSQSTDQDLIAYRRCGRYRRRRHKLRILANARIAINAVQHRQELGV